jgi:hypothetical protein
MRISQRGFGFYALLALGVVAVLFMFQYYATVKTFRYRLTMEIEADGKLHTASSIIEVKYIIEYDGLKQWNTQVRGVAPMIDLGKHGTIIAALNYDVADYARRAAAVGKVRKSIWDPFAANADGLPLIAYELHPRDIGSAKGKKVLQKYPGIVWVPYGGDWRTAQQLFPDELSTVVHRSIHITQITVEPASWAAVITRLELAPSWIEDLRVSQRNGVRTPEGKFVLNLHSQIERNGY